MIRKVQPLWKDRKHLFTPESITKLEFICTRVSNYPYYRRAVKIKHRAERCGSVVYILKDGKPIDNVDNNKSI